MVFYSFASEKTEEGSVHYVFSTDTNSIFSVYFNPPDFTDYLNELPSLSNEGILFGFCPIETGNDSRAKSNDPLISATILKIIVDYFDNHGTGKVLLYHCDNHDNRQSSRSRLFLRWEKNLSGIGAIHKVLPVQINHEDGSSTMEYLGFITQGNNEESLAQIQQELNEVSAMLITRKV